LHIAVYYNFRPTLTHLVLYYSNNTILTFDGKTSDTLSVLPDFHCLTHLDFINSSYDNTNELRMYDIQTICPKLHSLKFYGDISVSEQRVNTILAELDEEESPLNIINNNLEFGFATSYFVKQLY
jgi:hypothetical protein